MHKVSLVDSVMNKTRGGAGEVVIGIESEVVGDILNRKVEEILRRRL